MHTFASEIMNSCFGTTQAKFNTKISRNESNYNLTPPVNTTCKSQKGNKSNVCLNADIQCTSL